MHHATALEKHIDDQYSQRAEWYESRGETITRDYFLLEDYNGPSSAYDIAREVALGVAREMGEFVTFGVFDNCREHGLTVTGAGGWTFCWYEHRNTDDIHIEGCPTAEMKPFGPYGGVDKYDTLFYAPWQQYAPIVAALVAILKATVENPSITRSELKKVARQA